ncbi:probable disease resistance protein At5g45440 [Oryza brachyantha]|nr:probable disease resistance protein At5g45440 [Oryza brachyantha]
MEKLVADFDEEVDKPELRHQQELSELFGILRVKNGVVSQLPQDMKDQLAALLPEIDAALKQCVPSQEEAAPGKKTTKMKKAAALNMADCIPCKPKTHEDDDASPSSVVAPLLKRTRDILGDSPAPAAAARAEEDVLYEWTTSYVDEERLYGWDEEAKDVADGLAGPEDGGDDDEAPLFRAAGIFGIHGSGKTALAQKVFIHDRIKDTFPLRLWVCVGPSEHEDRFNLLYRMLDNLGLDTYKVEEVVNNSEAVKKHADAGNHAAAEESKIGVLLFILHATLAKTSYLIVFDDIRAYSDWYTNLLLPPPTDGEWTERLAYGLPKVKKSAVLITCRKEEHARKMVRTGRVFHPPPLRGSEAWMLFEREYVVEARKKWQGRGEYSKEDDRLYEELEGMQKEIVGKCLGLPVAIVEAAKGFALLDIEDDKTRPRAATAKPIDDADAGEA